MQNTLGFPLDFPMRRFSLLMLTAVFLAVPRVEAAPHDDGDEETMGYDAIVRELTHASPGNSSKAVRRPPRDPFDDILIHGGIGLASTMARVNHNGRPLNIDQRGFQAALGIDLFSENWLAEGTARSFGDTDYGRANVSLKEFDLKLYYHTRVTSNVGIRIGGGITARYLTIKNNGDTTEEYTTPASIGAFGLEYFLNRSISFGAELSARNTLIEETIDRNSVDGVIRVDTHF